MLNKLGERIGASLVVVFWIAAAWFLTIHGTKLLTTDLFNAFWVAAGVAATVGMAIRGILFVVLGRTLRTTYRRRYVT